MKSKLSLLIFIMILSALTFFAYPIIKNRYFNNGPKTIQNEEGHSTYNQEMNLEIMPEQESQSPEGELKSNILNITVTPSDCDNECKNFQKNDELEYCKEVCGLSAIEKTPEEFTDCGNKAGIQKDYCLKDLGISKKDFKTCDQITDNGIKKTCKDRITEDIIENQ